VVFSRPSSRVSFVTLSPTLNTLSERPLPPSTSSMLLRDRDVPSTVSVVKRPTLRYDLLLFLSGLCSKILSIELLDRHFLLTLCDVQ